MGNKFWKDEDILKYLAEGGEHANLALEAFYKKYRSLKTKEIPQIISRQKSNKEPEDLFQTALIALYRNVSIKGKTDIKPLKGYFLGIVRNLIIDQKRTFLRRSDLFKFSPLPSDPKTPEELAIINNVVDIVNGAIDMLKEECKNILRLSIQGYSLSDIMRKLKIVSYETTKSKSRECRRKLRNYFLQNQSLLRDCGVYIKVD